MDDVNKLTLKTDFEFASKQYDAAERSYEFYWNIALKVSAYFYTLSGAIGAFYIANASKPGLSIILSLPLVLGILLANSFWKSSQKVKHLNDWFSDFARNQEPISQQLGLGVQFKQTGLPLSDFLRISLVGFLLVALVSLFLIILPSITFILKT